MANNGPITVTFQANTPVTNNRGQTTENWADVAGLVGVTGEIRFRNPTDWLYQAAGGGQRLVSKEFLVFEPALSGVTEQHRVVIAGVNRKILKVRTYDEFDNQQIDIESIA